MTAELKKKKISAENKERLQQMISQNKNEIHRQKQTEKTIEVKKRLKDKVNK